jgi:solute carrier family 25 carnitine/acylcarnitine transporter 20/29
LSYSQYYLAGATAGIANTILSAPIEHVRIRLQTQPHGATRLYNGPLDCIKKLVSAGALYRATNVTLLREAQAYGLWFTTFEFLMNQEEKREEVPSWKIALYGGLAGEALWLGSYPMDVVKSKMQTDGLKGEERKYKNAVDCARQVLKAEGVMGFWRGLAPTLMRAMPVSAGTFFVVETTMRLIK